MEDQRGSVLVLTNSCDVTADVVLRLLAGRRVSVVRVDPGADFHEGASLAAAYRTGDQRGTLRTRSRELDLTRVRSVWVRRPSPYEGAPGLQGQDRRFSAEQSYWGTGGSSPPSRERTTSTIRGATVPRSTSPLSSRRPNGAGSCFPTR